MLHLKSGSIWEMLKPYVKKKCSTAVESYILQKRDEFEVGLRAALEPQLERLSVDITKQLQSLKQDVNVHLTFDEEGKN